MDNCHFENSETDAKYSKYKGRVVLRADVVMDDSGSYAVFTERRCAVKRIVEPPYKSAQSGGLGQSVGTFKQECRSVRRAGFASSTCANLTNAVEIYQAQFVEKVGGVCGGARSQRRGVAPTYFLFGTPV